MRGEGFPDSPSLPTAELTAPTVTCAARNCSADGCRYTLHCDASGSGSGNVSYSWSTGRKPLSEGPELLVEESSPDEPPLTCEARNPVSSSNATVSPAALCAGNGHGELRGWGGGDGLCPAPSGSSSPPPELCKERNGDPGQKHSPLSLFSPLAAPPVLPENTIHSPAVGELLNPPSVSGLAL